MPIVHCGEAIFHEHAQLLHTATDGSECDRIVPKSESWCVTSSIVPHCASVNIPIIPTLLLISSTRRFNVWCWLHNSAPCLCRDLHEMVAMPAISWTKSIKIHHESSGMQFGFFSSRYATTASRCWSNQVVTLIMLNQRVSQMRGHWLRLSKMKFCCQRKYNTSNVNVEYNVSRTAK